MRTLWGKFLSHRWSQHDIIMNPSLLIYLKMIWGQINNILLHFALVKLYWGLWVPTIELVDWVVKKSSMQKETFFLKVFRERSNLLGDFLMNEGHLNIISGVLKLCLVPQEMFCFSLVSIVNCWLKHEGKLHGGWNLTLFIAVCLGPRKAPGTDYGLIIRCRVFHVWGEASGPHVFLVCQHKGNNNNKNFG